MQFYVIALAVIGVVAADVSHLHLEHADGYNYNTPSYHASSSASSSASASSSSGQTALPGGDSSSYQPEHLIPQHLKAAHVESAAAEIIPGGDSSSYQPAHLIPQHLQAAQTQSFNIGADTHTPEQFIPEADRIAHAKYVQEQEQAQAVVPGGDSSSYQPAHLIPQHLQTASSEIVPGGDSSSYQPAHLIPQHLKASQATTSQSFNIGANTHTPEKFIPEADRIAHYNYIHTQTQTVTSGGDQAAHVETASAQIVPGGDSSSYQPAHLIPQHLKASQATTSQSFNIGANTHTPEQFIPEADRIAHYNYIHTQTQTVTSGGDQAAHVETASAQIVPGGDSSSYQPAHLIPQHLKASQATTSQSFNIGANTHTPEQFIPEADRVAHAQYVQEQEQAQAVVPGGDSSSYQPAHLIPQHLQSASASQTFNYGADTHTPEQFIPEADRIAHAQYVQEQEQQQQSPVVIGANTITPAHLYQEPVSNGIEEFNAETHVPVAIGRDTVTPAHLLPKYAASSASSSVSVGHGTQYGSNGGYVY